MERPGARPADINNAGEVVGNSGLPSSGSQAWYWYNGNLSSLAGSYSQANTINDGGVIGGGDQVPQGL